MEYVVEHCPDYVAPELILWLEANPIEVVRERKGPRLDLEIALQERDEKKKNTYSLFPKKQKKISIFLRQVNVTPGSSAFRAIKKSITYTKKRNITI